MMQADISPSLRALAQGDMAPLARAFSLRGHEASQVAAGILSVQAAPPACRPRVLISVGIHGDETGPIALVDALLDSLCAGPAPLQADLMLVVGNPAAIALNKRYLSVDLNRLFRTEGPPRYEGWEVPRAAEIMMAVHRFFEGHAGAAWHLDLHTAIRASLYPAFALIPRAVPASRRQDLSSFLQEGGVAAVVFNDRPSATFSAYTAARFGAASATVELGGVGPLAAYDGHRFGEMYHALARLLCGAEVRVDGQAVRDIAQFKVAQEMIKATPAFRLAFGPDLPNFSCFGPGSLLAEDGAMVTRCGDTSEYILFPNPDVDVGMRAGLSLVRTA